MLWLHRPPYLRWIGAVLLVLGALVLDLSERATVPHPFVAEEVTKGGPISADVVEWRDIPVGLLDAPLIDDAVAARRLMPGEPILVTSIGTPYEVPEGWWSVPQSAQQTWHPDPHSRHRSDAPVCEWVRATVRDGNPYPAIQPLWHCATRRTYLQKRWR